MTTALSTIEADLGSNGASASGPLAVLSDPVTSALRRQGFSSVSVGLRTAQVDGVLYELCPVGQAAVGGWLRGDEVPPRTRIRLVRRSMRQERHKAGLALA